MGELKICLEGAKSVLKLANDEKSFQKKTKDYSVSFYSTLFCHVWMFFSVSLGLWVLDELE